MKKILRWAYGKVPLKREMYSALRSLWVPPRSIYKHLYFTGTFRVPLENGSLSINHHGYEVENEIFWKGLEKGWEPVSMALWIELCKTARVVLDVGANTGVYALAAKTINPEAEVFAFEPIVRIFDKLIANRDLNGYDIHCINAAASSFDGKASIYETLTEHIYSVTVNRNLNLPDVPTVKVEINALRLDTFLDSLRNTPNVDLMKLDVETHEPEVLQGLGSYLTRCRPTMLVEILSSEVGEKVEDLLKDLDYLYFNIDEVSSPTRQSHLTKSNHYNFLICSEQKARSLRLL